MIQQKDIWYGAYLTEQHIKAVRDTLEKMFATFADAESKLEAKSFLSQYDAVYTDEFGGMFQMPDPEALLVKLKEVSVHRLEFRNISK